MANDRKGSRSQAEERFDRARKTTEVATSLNETERNATRKKTERLRELRQAKEAADRNVPIEEKPARQKGEKKRKT